MNKQKVGLILVILLGMQLALVAYFAGWFKSKPDSAGRSADKETEKLPPEVELPREGTWRGSFPPGMAPKPWIQRMFERIGLWPIVCYLCVGLVALLVEEYLRKSSARRATRNEEKRRETRN